jgi:DNA repair photolyase
MGTGHFVAATGIDECAYRRGYLCGMIRGDGLLASYEYERPGRSHGNQYPFRLALVDDEALDRTRSYLSGFGITVHECDFQTGVGCRPMKAIRTSARSGVERIQELVEWPLEPPSDWQRGFLAGIYDAEGSFSEKVLTISNTDASIIEHIARALRTFGFDFALERRRTDTGKPLLGVRLIGGLGAHLGFWHSIGNAISRKREIEGRALKGGARLGVRSIEPLGEAIPLYDITTGTGDFIADGVVSHNCYARPTHEYFGLSAGLDFETRIFVKEDAPALLRRELSSPKWQPKVLAMSGVTDPYQPIERKLLLTRRCLEVLAEFRNPVGIVTKSHLVTRDRDLLGELAGDQAAAVAISITTLDGSLAARMEPRASHPRERLRAIETLAAAGIPCGVMVAPVVPAITDHEILSILRAAADAGAGWAGFVVLRLPWAVKELFEEWLERHFPERKKKVLERVRSLRGGKLYEASFGTRMKGSGPFADQIRGLFTTGCRRAGLDRPRPELSTAAFRRPGLQHTLW